MRGATGLAEAEKVLKDMAANAGQQRAAVEACTRRVNQFHLDLIAAILVLDKFALSSMKRRSSAICYFSLRLLNI